MTMFTYLLTCLPCERYVWADSQSGTCERCKGELFNTGYAEYVEDGPVEDAE